MRKVKKVAAILGGMASVGAVAIGGVGLTSVAFPADPAHASPPGFSTTEEVSVCQGNGPVCRPPKHDNNGTVQVTVEITGPRGALKNGNTPDDVVDINPGGQCGPGNGKC